MKVPTSSRCKEVVNKARSASPLGKSSKELSRSTTFKIGRRNLRIRHITVMAHENLYDSLGYNIPNDDLTVEEKQSLIDTIATLDSDKKELIYLLILHDYVKINPHTKVIFPYKCKQVTNDRLEIKVDALPIRLKRILYKFCKLAEVSANESSEKTPTPST